MKVLQINSVCGVGSTGRIARDIALELTGNNIENYIAYGRQTTVENDHTLQIGGKLDYILHGVLTRLFDTHGLWGSEYATRKFIERIQQLDPDIIHLHNIHGYYINIKVLFDYLRVRGKPVIWTLHDCWSFTGHCAHFSYVGCERWLEGCRQCPQKKVYPASDFLDHSRQNYHTKKNIFTSLNNLTIVTPSKWLADLVKRSFLAQYPVRVIHNGIDTNVFQPGGGKAIRDKYQLGDRFIILGVASIWGESKGLEYFKRLSKILENHWTILLVGLNESQLADLPSNIIGIKRLANINELAQIYSAANVFVNPSVEETFGLVTAEALACGTPAIVFDSTPGVEIVDVGCGYVVEKGNLDQIKRSIQLINRNGKEEYSARCVSKVEKKFSKNDRYGEYLEIYKEVSGGKHC